MKPISFQNVVVPTMFTRERMGVAVIIQNTQSGEVLACQRIRCRDMNGLWQFPGGMIEHNESHVQAAMRETREETGLYFISSRFKPIAIGVGLTPDEEIFVTEFFKVEIGGFVAPENKEKEKHSDWEWVLPGELCNRALIPLAAVVLQKHFLEQ
jgi:8-oxo-dGTP diphosphatase